MRDILYIHVTDSLKEISKVLLSLKYYPDSQVSLILTRSIDVPEEFSCAKIYILSEQTGSAGESPLQRIDYHSMLRLIFDADTVAVF